jgi:signal transduction histidine kinase
MEEDEKGVLWLGTVLGLNGLKFKSPLESNQQGEAIGAGLITVNNEELKTYEAIWDIYNISTGYPVKDVNRESLYITRLRQPFGSQADSGFIWAGTGDKVIRFDPAAIVKNTRPPAVFIRSVSIGESSINWYGINKIYEDSLLIIRQEAMVFGKLLSAKVRDSLYEKFSDISFDSITPFYQVPQNLVLPYRHNRVIIDYGAIETNRPFMVRYQYLMEGYDNEWSPVTDKMSASYGNLSEGNYTFKLKAMSPEGVWSEPIAYNFKVLPPWYRSWWAYGFYALAIISVITIYVRMRTKSLMRQKLHLEDKVNLRTAQLEQSISNLKATQAQLIQSEKMASLGELTAGIAHEIQNPLNFINNFSELNKELLTELKDEIVNGNFAEVAAIAEDVIENQEKIGDHGKRADAIVKGMLQHSRTSTGVKEPTNINVLTDEYFRLAFQGMRARDKNFTATTETDFDENIGQVNIIPQDIGRVLLNLFNNAFYALSEKKKMHPEGYEPLVSVKTERSGNSIKITVRDNGMGIPEKVKEKIFQPFFTTKPTGQGTGLGLSLSYDIVKAHGGELNVASKEGEGSVFVLMLPYA